MQPGRVYARMIVSGLHLHGKAERYRDKLTRHHPYLPGIPGYRHHLRCHHPDRRSYQPHALGIGYDTIHALMYSNVVGLTLISLLIVKMLICSIAWDRVRRGASWLPC
jgi:hypothetical protein